MNKFYTTLFLSFILTGNLIAQITFAEFNAPNSVENIQSFVSQDSVFLFYNSHGSLGKNTKDLNLISEKGINHVYSTNIPNKTLVCGVLKYDSGFHIYYLESSRKRLTLNCLSFNPENGLNKIINQELNIEGTLVGSWITDSLSLAIYNKDKNQLKVVHLQDFQLVDEKIFDLPVDLRTDHKDLTFIPENAMLSIENGTAKYKLYKQKNFLIISIDHAFLESLDKIETEVAKLNLNDGSQAYYAIKSNSKSNFRSFVSNDLLYRSTISSSKFELDIFTIVNGDLLSYKEIIRDTSLQKTSTYFRYTKGNRISKQDNLYHMTKISSVSETSIVVRPDSCNTQIIWGRYHDKRSDFFPGSPIYPILVVSSFIIRTSINQMSKPLGISRYLYFTLDCDHEIKLTTPSNQSVYETIDNFEITMAKRKIPYQYKGYFPYGNNVIALYLESKTNVFKLIRF